ncbi:MAG: hypothetical protein ACTH31_08185, partial [Pseudoclavibacter sp.]
MTQDRPLTRRELREHERALTGEGGASEPAAPVTQSAPDAPNASVAPEAPVERETPQQSAAADAPLRRDRTRTTSVDPVEWRLNTQDMSSVRDELDARFASAHAAMHPGDPRAAAEATRAEPESSASSFASETGVSPS